MSYKKLLINRCDIFKLKTRQVAGGYGVPTQTEYYYNETPDYEDVPCRLIRGGALSSAMVVKVEPGVQIVSSFTAHFLIGTDVERGDIIVFMGEKYEVGIPYRPNNHHIEVEVVRQNG